MDRLNTTIIIRKNILQVQHKIPTVANPKKKIENTTNDTHNLKVRQTIHFSTESFVILTDLTNYCYSTTSDNV